MRGGEYCREGRWEGGCDRASPARAQLPLDYIIPYDVILAIPYHAIPYYTVLHQTIPCFAIVVLYRTTQLLLDDAKELVVESAALAVSAQLPLNL